MAFNKINEYLNTDTGSEGTLLIPKLILSTMIEEADKHLLDRSLSKFILSPTQFVGSSMNVNLVDPNTGDIREVGEGSEIPLDSQSYSAIEFRPVKFGMAIRITREMIEDSQFELLQSNIRMAGKRFAENETKLILEELEGAANTVTGGASITIANLTTAMFNLEENDFTPTDLIIGNEVLQDLRNIDTFAEADKWGDTTSFNRTGFVGMVYGLRVHRFSTNAAPAASFTRNAYVIDRTEAYAIAISRDVSVENFTLPTFDTEGAVVTQRIQVRLLRSSAVSNITTT